MRQHKHTLSFLAAAFVLLATAVLPVHAQEMIADPTSQFCFSAEDFLTTESEDGIFLTAVPKRSAAVVCHGGRILRAGDAIPAEMLDQLTLESACVTPQHITISYYTVANGTISDSRELKFSILPKKNEAPIAERGEFETYRNIPNSGTLPVRDPENGALTYHLEDEPKRGVVELHEDGTFTYTPKENKVGKDSFTYYVEDEAGNRSETATIKIEIMKPTDQRTYADMTDDPAAFDAMWLKDQGYLTGTAIGGNLCFEPERTLSRGEFLVMVMKLVDAEKDTTRLTSGFADETQTPDWMQPYIVSAFGNGMITGTQSDEGLMFRPADVLTCSEAAVILQNTLHLPVSETKAVASFPAENTVPVWAEEAVSALTAAGIDLELVNGDNAMTRRDAARLFYDLNQLLTRQSEQSFYWVQ